MTLENPQISICIVTYERDDELIHSLAKLQESTFCNYEILIVDNGRSVKLLKMLQDCGLRRPWRLIQAQENKGCANLNLIFPMAKGELIVCFDDDSFPRVDCLERAVAAFTEDKHLGMVGFKMHVPETGEAWHDRWWNPESTTPRATVLCPGCGMAFRNDPRLPAELCIPNIVSQAHELSIAAEIARLGYKIEFRPECIAYHPDTTLGYSGKKAEAGALNQLRFLVRYADSFTLWLLIFTHWLVRLRGLPNRYAFLREHAQKATRSPLKRSTMARFHEVLKWHIHPWLRFLIP